MNVASEESPSGRLGRALAAAAVPDQLRQALAATPPDPRPGQLWRARRGDTVMLVLLNGAGGAAVDAVPVTMDPGFETEDAVVLQPDMSSLEVRLTVWLGLARTLPLRVLDRYVGAINLDSFGDPVGTVRAVGRPGRPAVSPVDPVLEYRARISDATALLATAPLTAGSGDLPKILAAAGVTASRLAQVLEVDLPMVLQLRRGQAALGPTQAERLAPFVGRGAEDLMAANPAPPASLVAQAAHPRRRGQVIALAQAKRISEDAAYTQVLFGTYALAARATGDTDTGQAWNARLDRYFELVLNA